MSNRDESGRVRRNFLELLGGRAMSTVLTLGATALMARALAPENFGLVVMVHSFLLAMQGLTRLNSFDAVVHFGVPAQERDDDAALTSLLRLTVILDLGAAALGTLLACLLVNLAGSALGWDAATVRLATLYALLLLSGATGAASGVLRLYDRFDALSRHRQVGPMVRLAGVALAWWQGVDQVGPFLAAHGAGWLTQNLYLMAAGWRERRRRRRPGGGDPGWWPRNDGRFPGLGRFFHTVYWQGNLDLLPKHVSVLAAGFLLGPAMAGMFRLAMQFSRVLTVPGLLLRQVLFPDLTRLWLRGDPRFSRLLGRVLTAAGAAGATVVALSWFLGEPLLTLVAGPDYRAGAPALHWLMLAAALDMGAAPLRAAGYAMGAARSVLAVYGLSLVVYVAAFPLLSLWLGLAGAGMAGALASLLVMMGMARQVSLRAKHPPAKPLLAEDG